jgi:hypothetical protein
LPANSAVIGKASSKMPAPTRLTFVSEKALSPPGGER